MESSPLKKVVLRSLTPSENFSVRRSQEEIAKLQKENFNLKLKLYYIESNKCLKFPSELIDVETREQIEIFMENAKLKKDLKDKTELIKTALTAIEMLETKNIVDKKESQSLIMHLKRIKMLKRNKMQRTPHFQRKIIHNLKRENSNLSKRIQELMKFLHEKTSKLNESSKEKCYLLSDIEKRNSKLKESEILINQLKSENDNLKRSLITVEMKSLKMERDNKNLRQLSDEQIKIIKALNRTIEAKNGEFFDYKTQLEPDDKKFVFDELIDLKDLKLNEEMTRLPFHNPIFGSFENKQ